MTSQVFNPFEVEPTQPFMLRDILPGPAWAPFQAAPQCPTARVQAPAQAGPRKKYRMAAVLAAVCLEVAIPLGVFGIWELWSHLR
jgi:hypothetical protein